MVKRRWSASGLSAKNGLTENIMHGITDWKPMPHRYGRLVTSVILERLPKQITTERNEFKHDGQLAANDEPIWAERS